MLTRTSTPCASTGSSAADRALTAFLLLLGCARPPRRGIRLKPSLNLHLLTRPAPPPTPGSSATPAGEA